MFVDSQKVNKQASKQGKKEVVLATNRIRFVPFVIFGTYRHGHPKTIISPRLQDSKRSVGSKKSAPFDDCHDKTGDTTKNLPVVDAYDIFEDDHVFPRLFQERSKIVSTN